jgi:hypothetical protein
MIILIKNDHLSFDWHKIAIIDIFAILRFNGRRRGDKPLGEGYQDVGLSVDRCFAAAIPFPLNKTRNE